MWVEVASEQRINHYRDNRSALLVLGWRIWIEDNGILGCRIVERSNGTRVGVNGGNVLQVEKQLAPKKITKRSWQYGNEAVRSGGGRGERRVAAEPFQQQACQFPPRLRS